jgi:hypothetical protein
MNQLSGAIQENRVEGERQTVVTTKTFGMQLSKSQWNEIGNNSLPVLGENGETFGSFLLPKGDDLLTGDKYSVGNEETIGVQVSVGTSKTGDRRP